MGKEVFLFLDLINEETICLKINFFRLDSSNTADNTFSLLYFYLCRFINNFYRIKDKFIIFKRNVIKCVLKDILKHCK